MFLVRCPVIFVSLNKRFGYDFFFEKQYDIKKAHQMMGFLKNIFYLIERNSFIRSFAFSTASQSLSALSGFKSPLHFFLISSILA